MNGYENWETWNACLWINNTKKSYFEIKNNQNKYIKNLTKNPKETLKRMLKLAGCTDNINIEKVNIMEVISNIQEM